MVAKIAFGNLENQTVQKNKWAAGDVVVTDMGAYQHYSVVSDRRCAAGKLMLISATQRNGTVREEPYDIVAGKRNTYVVQTENKRPVSEVLKLAREQIDSWKYCASSNNCEHFKNYVLGLEVTSRQVTAAVGGSIIGATVVASLANAPNTLKLFLGASLGAVIALYTAKATAKRVEDGPA
ncbi:lecithin retinol acyltransferase family protein [uncultured Aliiroseovarius sp.]|uniref:lecithin retinol acyltransferase family protein n=1 Tax=uncultured Aliiroseovarius sp. TaxID=1658783 RepID=UPI002618D8D6|nr:lecithin retinol acyltransferase family protein [uncultured Aliiroseovarius sp.]